jgi:DnaJ-related protein SCJ1
MSSPHPILLTSSRKKHKTILTDAKTHSNNQSAHDKFVAIAEAYETLSDEESRRIYDQYGHEGLKQHKQGGGRGQHHDPFDLFSRFFGGSGHFGHHGHSGKRQGQDKRGTITLPLRDFYNGVEKEFEIEKQVVCSACEGSGSKDGKVDTCQTCGGRGITIQRHNIAPGIFQQVQAHCQSCGGKGKTIRHPCPICNGQRVTREKEKYTLHVERGVPRGAEVRFEQEADEHPDWEAGDLIIEVQEGEPHIGQDAANEDPLARTDGTFFRRRGQDLFWREVLSLREAWMGDWTRNITHLDGHVVKLHRPRGKVIQPGQVDVIDGEGMPLWHPDHAVPETEFGKLHVEYVVVLPDQMESGMEKEFFALWEKWRKKKGVNLEEQLGRPAAKASVKDEL